MRLTGSRQGRQLIASAMQDGLDDTVHQQIRVAPDWTGEMRISLKSQTEMPAVDRRVNRLLHRTQQHAVDLLRIHPVFGGVGNRLKMFRLRRFADLHADTNGFEIVTQNFNFFRRRPFVHPKQRSVFAVHDVVGAANVGGQHGLFNQTVGFVANPGNNFFNSSAFIANNLCFSGFKIHGAALLTRLEQGPVDIVQIEQIIHARLVLERLRPACVGQNSGDIGVGETRMAVHDSFIKLVGEYFAIHANHHVAHHAQTIHMGIERTQAVG